MNKLIRVTMIVILLIAGAVTAPPQSVQADPNTPPVTMAPTQPVTPNYPEMRLRALTAPESRFTTMAAPITDTTALITNPTIDMKVLVIHGNGYHDDQVTPPTEHPYNMVKSYLDILGIPYDAVELVGEQVTIDETTFWDGINHGHYYAIFFTTSGDWMALSSETQDVIAAYERNFGVRRVTWYSIPNPSYNGMECALVDPNCIQAGSGIEGPIGILMTDVGQEVFPYVQPDVELTLLALSDNTYGYPATTTLGSEVVTPLFLDANGNIAMAIFRPGDGREHLAFTWSSYYPATPPVNVHARVLPYGIINWATKGIFLGERHVYFVPQPDDVFAWGDRWDVENKVIIEDSQEYRLEPHDLDNLVVWMNDLRANTPNAADFKMEMPFNAEGTNYDVPTGTVTPSLTARAIQLQNEFIWLNHTYSHEDLNTASYNLAYGEIMSNTEKALELGFSDYTTTTLLTGAYSGLTNTNVTNAAYDLGVRYILVNASVVPTYTNPSPNTGIPHLYNDEILLVPRHANNIFYFSVTPEEETDYYNWMYCEGYAASNGTIDPCFDYETVIEQITDQSLQNLLDFNVNATMFHMNNMIAYSSTQTNTILSDFVESLYGKYNALYNDNVPILSLRTQEIGEKMWERMAYDTSGVSAVWTCGDAITLTVTDTARIPVTGINSTLAAYTETYAGQDISYFDMEANDVLFIPGAQASIPEQISGLSVVVSDAQNALTWDAVTTDTNGAATQALFYRVYRGDTLLADRVTTTAYTDTNPIPGVTYTVTAIGDNCWKLESEGASATPTTLLDFSASVLEGSVTITWTTAVETNTTGFNLYVSTNPGDPSSWTLVNTEVIGVKPSQVYTFTDPTDRRGGTFYYRLEEVETAGTGSARLWYPAISIGIGPNAVSLVGVQARTSPGSVLAQLGTIVVLVGVVLGTRKRRRVR